MCFGISKCAKLTINRDKVIQTGPLPVMSDSEITELEIASPLFGFP